MGLLKRLYDIVNAREFPLPLPGWLRYFSAVGMFALALATRFLILPQGAGLGFLTFYPATAFSAILFGTGPGFLVVGLSAVTVHYLFMTPYYVFKFQYEHVVSVLFFTFSGSVICLIVERMRRNAQRAKESNQRLTAAMAELEVLNTRLTEMDRVKTEFFSNVSHEFRTPLTLMLGPMEELLSSRGALEGEVRESLGTMHRNALRLLHLVNNLLDFSSIEAGRTRAVWEATDLASFTADLASNFQSACERGGVKLVVDCPPLPQLVEVDRGMWEKVVLNLISNAIKYTHQGQIAVRMRVAGRYAEMTVSDTGIGIPAADVPHLFERFYRVQGARGRSYEGSGIGLALVSELVRLQGGSIGVESREGEGSVFSVRIPLDVLHEAKEGQPERAAREGMAKVKAFTDEANRWIPEHAEAGVHESAAGGNKARIVVADDNADMRAYIQRLLTEAGYAVEVAADGEAAFALCAADPPALLLSDVMMPVLDGFGLLTRLRAEERTSTLPVILLSARAGEESRIDGLSTGADDYLIKPFHARELIARVDGAIRLAKTRRETEDALRAAKETAEDATRLKDKFVSLVSHDLKGPLGAMKGFLRLLRDDLEELKRDDLVRFVDIARESTDRMLAMITDLLSVSRFTTGKIRPYLRPFDARALVERELVLFAPIATRKDVRLVNEVPDACEMCGDPALFAEVVQNLISNAIKFSPGGSSVRVLNPEPGVIAVADEGVGIPLDRIPKLFRYDEKTSTPGTLGEVGTGFGLPLAYDIMKGHGGDLSAVSEPGKGSIFSARLPVKGCPAGNCEGPKGGCRRE